MKKLSVTLALLLCLLLCVFAFASCDKNKKTDNATAALTTATTASSDCAHVPASDYSIDTVSTCTTDGQKSIHCTVCGKSIPGTEVALPAGHVAASEYTVDVEPTCTTPGSKSYHCVVCNAIVEETKVVLDPVSTEHRVEWIVDSEATIFNQTGHRHGTCSLCHQPLEEDTAFQPTIVNSKTAENVSNGDPNYGAGSFYVSMNAADARGEKHFYPNDDDPSGNDLWFEYSLLWNPTLTNYDGQMRTPDGKKYDNDRASVISLISFRMMGGNGGTYKDFYRLSVKDGTSVDCPYAGGINLETYRPNLSPAYACIYDLGLGEPYYKGVLDETVTAASYPVIGEYGWHRIGFRFHQDAKIDNDHPYPSTKNANSKTTLSGYSELYIDGVRIWKVETSLQGTWDDTKGEWAGRWDGLYANGIHLYFASVDPNDETRIVYNDNDKLIVEMKMQDLFTCEDAVYVVYDDVHLSCGNGFVLNVQPNAAPAETTITLDEGVTVPGTIHFKPAD